MEKHIIENKFLKIEVKETGAELCSIWNKKNKKQYLWQADPEIWSSHAPNLFPIIGVLKDGIFKYDGKSYKMPKHGFIRYNENVRLKERKDNLLVFELTYSEETLKIYPFKFNFRISFSLKDNELEVKHHVINLDEKPVLYSLGGHPAFNIQLFKEETINDYYLEFDTNMDMHTNILNSDGLVSSKTENMLDNDRKIILNQNIFNKDALIFQNIEAKKVDLKSKKNGNILSVSYKDFQNLGIWAKPGAPYVCIEPWLGIADLEDTDQNLENKAGIIELPVRQEFVASYTITIN